MSSNTRKKILLFVLVFSLLAAPRPTRACGPFTVGAVFTFNIHPDYPLENFAQGELGVLQPTYARSYLIAAYRHMNGTGLNPAEQQALVSLWKERINLEWKSNGDDEITRWREARKRVAGLGEAPEISVWRSMEPRQYTDYLNCTNDAFRTATATLEERIKKFGAASPAVKSWLEAQDIVFANCDKGTGTPAPADSAADPLIRADRAYQIAAAHFYAERYDQARQAFEAIARDSSSPWRTRAPYLVARTLLRKGGISEGPAKQEALGLAEQQLRKILADASLSATREDAVRLLNLVRLRLRPQERLRELAQTLLRPNVQATLKQDVWDYTTILDKFLDESPQVESETDKVKFKDLPSVGREDDMTDWVVSFQVTDQDAFAHALQRWTQTSSLSWLVAALTDAPAGHSAVASLLQAADRVKPSSPAFPSVAFHAARLLVEGGRDTEARTRLDALLAQDRASLSPSARNLFLGLRMRVARDLDEYLRFAQRNPSAFSYDDDGRELPQPLEEVKKDEQLKPYTEGRTMFDADSVADMNQRFPLQALKDAASSDALPEHLRRNVAITAWVRAVLLNDREADRALVPVLLNLVPELKGIADADLDSPNAEARKFSTLYALLKFPGLQPYVDAGLGRTTPLGKIDNYRDNWWCAYQLEVRRPQSEDQSAAAATDKKQADAASPTPAAPSPKFLTAAQQTAAARERARLAALDTAPNYLARLALEWANKSPQDPRVPEALHLAVRATRYGCTDERTGALSKAAHQLLHRRYPKSEWAKKTPYWFKEN